MSDTAPATARRATELLAKYRALGDAAIEGGDPDSEAPARAETLAELDQLRPKIDLADDLKADVAKALRDTPPAVQAERGRLLLEDLAAEVPTNGGIANTLETAEALQWIAHLLTRDRAGFDAAIIRLDGAGYPAKQTDALHRAARDKHRGPPAADQAPAFDPQTGKPTGPPLARLRSLLGIEFIAIETAGDDFHFKLRSRRTGEPVDLGPIPAELVLEPRKMRGKLWRAVGGEPIHKHTDEDWALIAALIDQAAEHRDDSFSADRLWRDRLHKWTGNRRGDCYDLTDDGKLTPDDKRKILHGLSGEPDHWFTDSAGHLWLRQDEFEHNLRRGQGITLRGEGNEVNKALTHLHFESVTVQARVGDEKKPTKLAYWRSPPGFLG